MTALDPTGQLADIDWSSWEPVDRATLLFVLQEEQILLIRKKRGLGAGKINGPGGRLEPGESPRECALRELHEELGIRAWSADWRGKHRFEFRDGYRLEVEVFVSEGFEGEPIETDEAVPLWFPIDAIPYDEMWADDRYWVPALLAGEKFDGRWVFDGDRLLGGGLVILSKDHGREPPAHEPGRRRA